MRRFLQFGLISTFGAGIDFVITLALIDRGFSAYQALAVAMFFSASIVYVLHQKLTFADVDSSELRGGRYTGFLLNTLAIFAFRAVFLEILFQIQTPNGLAVAIVLISSVIINYSVSRLLIFVGGRKE